MFVLTGEELSLVGVGDAFVSKRLSVFSEERGFSSLIKIIRDADVAFVNLETAIHEYEGWPIGEGKGDAYGQADPYIADELKEAGFDLVSRANNHSMDYSAGGMTATSKNLDRVGLTHAGVGVNLAEAREPVYLENKRGIVSLISACTFPLGAASYPRNDVPGRPGMNPLRIETVYDLDPATFKTFKNVADKLGVLPANTSEDAKDFTFPSNVKFRLGKECETIRTLNKSDLDGNLKAISDARKLSDCVIFSLHDHTPGLNVPKGFKGRDFPAESISFFRACLYRWRCECLVWPWLTCSKRS